MKNDSEMVKIIIDIEKFYDKDGDHVCYGCRFFNDGVFCDLSETTITTTYDSGKDAYIPNDYCPVKYPLDVPEDNNV